MGNEVQPVRGLQHDEGTVHRLRRAFQTPTPYYSLGMPCHQRPAVTRLLALSNNMRFIFKTVDRGLHGWHMASTWAIFQALVKPPSSSNWALS